MTYKIWPVLLFGGLVACHSPKKSTDKVSTATQTKTELDSAIHHYFVERTQQNQSVYHFENDTSEAHLTLLKINSERMPLKSNPNQYVVDANMLNSDSDLYQVDFFLEKKQGQFKVVQTKLQKLNSRAYYVWSQDSTGAWYTINAKNAPDSLMNVLNDTYHFDFTYTATIPKHSKPAQIWIPIAQNSHFQDVKITSIEAPGKHDIITDSKYDNKALYAQLAPSDKAQKIVVKYKVKHWEKTPYKDKNADPKSYLSATPLLPLGGHFAQIDDAIFKKTGAKTDMEKARAIYHYIIDNMRYNKVTKYGTGSSVYACDKGTGNCTEFHSLFLSLCRTANIPARFFIGAELTSTKNKGSVGYHCWVEFFTNGEWYPVDISEAFKYPALEDYYFGHNPSNRFVISQGRDIQFNPGPKTGPIDYFIYPYMVVNGQKVFAKSSFSYQRTDAAS